MPKFRVTKTVYYEAVVEAPSERVALKLLDVTPTKTVGESTRIEKMSDDRYRDPDT